MDEYPSDQSACMRGWTDTKRQHSTLLFWSVELIVSAIVTAITANPLIMPVSMAGLVVLVLLFNVTIAPVRQRNEARKMVAEVILESKDPEWVNLEDGGRYYRDLLSDYGMRDGVKMFDSMSSPHPEQPTSNPVASAFRWIVQAAINEGEMEVWGVPENGSKPEKISHTEDDMIAYRKSREGDSMFLMVDGVYYRNLQVKRTTIKSYVEHVRDHDADLYDA